MIFLLAIVHILYEGSNIQILMGEGCTMLEKMIEKQSENNHEMKKSLLHRGTFVRKSFYPHHQRRLRGLGDTALAYKCVRALFLSGFTLTALSYSFIYYIFPDATLMSNLLGHAVPLGTTFTISSNAWAILWACAIFTGFCLAVMFILRPRKRHPLAESPLGSDRSQKHPIK